VNPIGWLIGLWNWIRGLRDTTVFDEVADWGGWRYVGPVLAFFFVAAATALQQLTNLLKSTHLPGAGSYGPISLSNLGFHEPDSEAPSLIVKTWLDAAQSDIHGPARILQWAMYVDWTFLVLYCALLALWLIKVGGALRATREDDVRLSALANRRLGITTETDLAQAKTRVGDLIDTYRLIVVIGLVLVPLLGLADAIENKFTLLVYDDPGHWFWWLWIFAALKTAFFVLVIATALISTLALISLRWTQRRRLLGTLVAVRAQLLLGTLFCAFMLFDPTGQAEDSIRRWEPHWTQALAPLLLTMAFGLLLAVDARSLIALAEAPLWPAGGYGWLGPVALLGGGGLLLGLGIWTNATWHVGLGLVVLGGIIIGVAILSLSVANLPVDEPVEILPSAPRLSAFLAILPPVALGVLAFRASFSEIAYAHHPEYAWLLGSALSYQLAGWCLYMFVVRWSPGSLVSALLRLLGLTVAVVFVIGTISSPWGFSPAVGTLGVLAAFVVTAAVAFYGLAWIAEHIKPMQALALLRFRRIPIFLLLFLWATLAAVVDSSGSYYDARIIRATATMNTVCPTPTEETPLGERIRCHDLTAVNLLERWLKRNAPEQSEPPEKRLAVPLVFVATEGGGIRAAYWTTIALRCVFEGRGEGCDGAPERRERVFAMSGVSGGAVGLANYTTHLAHSPNEVDWPVSRLDHDFLAPTTAWALFVDLPFAFLRRGGGTDRAEVLERAWQDAWGSNGDDSALSDGLYAQWQESAESDKGPHVPLLFLNGTRVQDGCRFETSVVITSVGSGPDGSPVTAADPLVRDCLAVRLFEKVVPKDADPKQADPKQSLYVPPANRGTWTLGATTDVAADLCPGDDVRLSTAALLAARFPYVTPSGRLEKCTGGSPVNVVDGGYFENTGTSTIVEVWESLRARIARNKADTNRPCVVPVLLEIDNHYASAPGPAPAGRPWESSVPVQTLGAGRNARDAQSRQAAAIAFGQASFDGFEARVAGAPAVIDRIAHIFPRAHPGTEAPLGWTLSRAAERDLDQRLGEDNVGELNKIRDWFAGDLSCAPA
jgi:hypothetical protein